MNNRLRQYNAVCHPDVSNKVSVTTAEREEQETFSIDFRTSTCVWMQKFFPPFFSMENVKNMKNSLGGWDHKFLQCAHTRVRFTCDLIELKNIFLCHNMFVKHQNDAMTLWIDLSIYETAARE